LGHVRALARTIHKSGGSGCDFGIMKPPHGCRKGHLRQLPAFAGRKDQVAAIHSRESIELCQCRCRQGNAMLFADLHPLLRDNPFAALKIDF
jgi:hypothetical protein